VRSTQTGGISLTGLAHPDWSCIAGSDVPPGRTDVILATARLTLRPFQEDDLDAYMRIANDPSVLAWLTHDGAPLTRNQYWRRVASYAGHWSFRRYGPFAVVLRESGSLIGHAGPWFPADWPGPELLWMIDPAYRGNGYAPEAVIAARTFMYDHMGCAEMISLIEPRNVASRRVAEKVGATLRDRSEHDGHFVDVYVHPRRSA
jgi:RimJ/RimL family protein N-acetyltransferase